MADSLMSRFPNVEYLGFKSGEDLMNLVRGAAFTVVPSEWYENCSMVVLESMAMGKPVIGARIGGLPEQVVDGETGLLFESGNVSHLAKQMDTLLRDNSLIKKMGKTARKRVEAEYSLDKHMQNLYAYYDGLRKGTLQ